MSLLLIRLGAAALIFTGAATPESGPEVQRAGSWEVVTNYGDLEISGADRGVKTELINSLEFKDKAIRCFGARAPTVGAMLRDGECAYTRVEDTTRAISRSAVCKADDDGTVDTIEMEGKRNSVQYELHVITTKREAEKGTFLSAVDVVEAGKWMSPNCVASVE